MDNPRYIDLNKLTARLPVLNDSGEYLIAISDVRRAISLAQAETGEVEEVVRCKDCDRGQHDKGYADGLFHREDEWISVEERLPDENGRLLTVDRKGDMMVCYWEKHFGWFASVCNKNAITHWMPLPEPPKMKEDCYGRLC